jgi:archaellum component FlaC
VALIVVALAAGIFIAGLRKKVNRLESRVERLEQLVEAGNSG